MNDERFARDLTAVLRDIAGRGAPPSLHARVATLLDVPPVAPRPWFAAPLRLSLAAAAVVVIAVTVIFVSQLPQVGPFPSASPVPPSPSATTPLPSASPVEPSPSATTPAPTPTPTPPPTLIPAAGWTGLDWSDRVTGPKPETGSVLLVDDILPWANGYVGVGARVSGLLADGETGKDYWLGLV